MLPSINRLRKKRDILAVLKEGSRRKGRFFRLIFKKSANASLPRIAVVVGMKEAKNAVARNAIKRKTREVVRRFIPELHGYDVLVFPLKNIQQADFFDLVTEFAHHANTLQAHRRSHYIISKNPLA